MLAIGIALLFALFPFIMNRLEYTAVYTFTNLHPSKIHTNDIIGLFAPYFIILAQITLPFLLILMIAGIFVVRMQVGPLFTVETIKPKFDKLSPMGMLKALKENFNIFAPKKLVELTKSFLKMLIVGAFAYSVIDSRKQELFTLLGAELSLSFTTIVDILSQIVVNTCIIMIILGFFDKKYQNYEFEKSIKMTKQEIKDERKNAEGDPVIKSKIKAAQMRFAQQRMMSEIPTANVVVTNPTHYAVAIRYDTTKAPAPQVVAKGVDYVAFKIREIAENNNIPIVENKPLARTLYKLGPLEGIIPAELYVAVAEVLAYVYRLNKDKRPV